MKPLNTSAQNILKFTSIYSLAHTTHTHMNKKGFYKSWTKIEDTQGDCNLNLNNNNDKEKHCY